MDSIRSTQEKSRSEFEQIYGEDKCPRLSRELPGELARDHAFVKLLKTGSASRFAGHQLEGCAEHH